MAPGLLPWIALILAACAEPAPKADPEDQIVRREGPLRVTCLRDDEVVFEHDRIYRVIRSDSRGPGVATYETDTGIPFRGRMGEAVVCMWEPSFQAGGPAPEPVDASEDPEGAPDADGAAEAEESDAAGDDGTPEPQSDGTQPVLDEPEGLEDEAPQSGQDRQPEREPAAEPAAAGTPAQPDSAPAPEPGTPGPALDLDLGDGPRPGG